MKFIDFVNIHLFLCMSKFMDFEFIHLISCHLPKFCFGSWWLSRIERSRSRSHSRWQVSTYKQLAVLNYCSKASRITSNQVRLHCDMNSIVWNRPKRAISRKEKLNIYYFLTFSRVKFIFLLHNHCIILWQLFFSNTKYTCLVQKKGEGWWKLMLNRWRFLLF